LCNWLRTTSLQIIRLVVVAALLSSSAAAAEREIEAYANIDGAEHSISRSELRAVFLGRTRTWKDGTPTHLVLLEDSSPIHKKFCREVLGLFSHQLRSAWDRKVHSGTGQAPMTVGSLDEMLSIINKTPGAVGYRYTKRDISETRTSARNDH
jgi:ABC-type phosphate transport system substrate-binding protein